LAAGKRAGCDILYELAEYKQVTVLFADVVHSMDIAAAVGAAARDHGRAG
jgi:class 3 adenylate cyclase